MYVCYSYYFTGRRAVAREAETMIKLEQTKEALVATEKERDSATEKYKTAVNQIVGLEQNVKELTEKVTVMSMKLTEIGGEEMTQQLLESTGLMWVLASSQNITQYMGRPVFQRLYFDAEDRMARSKSLFLSLERSKNVANIFKFYDLLQVGTKASRETRFDGMGE